MPSRQGALPAGVRLPPAAWTATTVSGIERGEGRRPRGLQRNRGGMTVAPESRHDLVARTVLAAFGSVRRSLAAVELRNQPGGVTNDPSANIWANGKLSRARSGIDSSRGGCPRRRSSRCRTDDGRTQNVAAKRSVTAFTVLTGLVSYGLCFIFCWSTPRRSSRCSPPPPCARRRRLSARARIPGFRRPRSGPRACALATTGGSCARPTFAR
jgi:hypothetical protein